MDAMTKLVKISKADLEWLIDYVESEWRGPSGMLFHDPDDIATWDRVCGLLDD